MLKKALVSGSIAVFIGVFIFGLSSVFGATFPPIEVPPGGLTSPTFSGISLIGNTGITSDLASVYIKKPLNVNGGIYSTGSSTFGTVNATTGIVDIGFLTVKDVADFLKKLTVVNGGIDVKNGGNLNVSGTIANGAKADANPVVIDDNLTVSSDIKLLNPGFKTLALSLTNSNGHFSNLFSGVNVIRTSSDDPIPVSSSPNELLLVANDGVSIRGESADSSLTVVGNLNSKSVGVIGSLKVGGSILRPDGTNYLKPVKVTGSPKVFASGVSGYLNDTSCPTGYYAISCEYASSGGWGFYETDIQTAMSGSTGYCSIAGKNTSGGAITVTGYANCVKY